MEIIMITKIDPQEITILRDSDEAPSQFIITKTEFAIRTHAEKGHLKSPRIGDIFTVSNCEFCGKEIWNREDVRDVCSFCYTSKKKGFVWDGEDWCISDGDGYSSELPPHLSKLHTGRKL